MSNGKRGLAASLIAGFLFFALSVLLEWTVGGTRPRSVGSPQIVAGVLLWLLYSTMSWAAFFMPSHRGPVLSARLFKSLGVGALVIAPLLGLMLYAGTAGGLAAIAYGVKPRDVSWGGVIFFWIMIAGLCFVRTFGPKGRCPECDDHPEPPPAA